MSNRNYAGRSIVVTLIVFLGVIAGNLPLKWLINRLNREGRYNDVAVLMEGGRLDHLDLALGFQLFLLFIPFVLAFGALLASSYLLLDQTPSQIASSTGKFRWKRTLTGFLIWFGISAAFDAINGLFRPQDYMWNFQGLSWLSLNFWLLLLLPLQTGAEEFFFRGFLMERLGGRRGKSWLPLLIPALIFTLLHLSNREVREYGMALMVPQYLAMALFFGYVCLKQQGLEMVWGIHLANNWYGLSLVNLQGSSVATPSLFIMTNYNPVLGLVGLLSSIAIFLFILSFSENSQPHQS